MNPITFQYQFRLENGLEKTFVVEMDPATLLIRPLDKEAPPDWARLEFNQCEKCPLDRQKEQWCPIARNISGLVKVFGDIFSIEKAEVTVVTKERTYLKRTSTQDGLFSILGIYMTASGCPVMDKLKPMVRYHLPFSTIDETIYRVVTMYMAAQYYRMKKNFKPDWDLSKLISLYDEIKVVNRGLLKRLKAASKKESLLNAVVILDAFASLFQGLSQKSVDSLENLFAPHLKDD